MIRGFLQSSTASTEAATGSSEETKWCYEVSADIVRTRNEHPKICEECPEACALSHGVAAVVQQGPSVATCNRAFMFAEVAFQVAKEWLGEAELYNQLFWKVQRNCMHAVTRAVSEYPPLVLEYPSHVVGVPVKTNRTAVYIFNNPTTDPDILGPVHLWRCWAEKHGVAFVFDTDDSEGRANGVDARWWRWRRIKDTLSAYDWLIVVQADMFVQPDCWDLDFLQTFEYLFQTKHIVTKELFAPQTLNDGFVAFRNSAPSRWFLDRVFEKHAWKIRNNIFDQGTFFESILEILEAEKNAETRLNFYPNLSHFFVKEHRPDGDREFRVKPDRNRYMSDCMKMEFHPPGPPGRLVHQTFCFHAWLQELAGPPGARNSAIFGFVDPRVIDVNNVRLNISDHIVEDAFIHHFAGREHKIANLRTALKDYTSLTCEELNARPPSGKCRYSNQGVPTPRSYCPPRLGICKIFGPSLCSIFFRVYSTVPETEIPRKETEHDTTRFADKQAVCRPAGQGASAGRLPFSCSRSQVGKRPSRCL